MHHRDGTDEGEAGAETDVTETEVTEIDVAETKVVEREAMKEKDE